MKAKITEKKGQNFPYPCLIVSSNDGVYLAQREDENGRITSITNLNGKGGEIGDTIEDVNPQGWDLFDKTLELSN